MNTKVGPTTGLKQQHICATLFPIDPKIYPHRTRITAGGDRLEYFGNITTHTSGMEAFKILLNCIISTPNARYCTADISNMYLCSTLDQPEFVKFKVSMILDAIVKHYNLESLIHNRYVYARIKKAWYGLK